MKKILFIITGILFSLNTFAQRISLNKSISVDIPKGGQKITKEQAIIHARTKFNNNKIILGHFANTPVGNRLYKIDNVVITLNPFDTTKVKLRKGYALLIKNGVDEMAHGDPTYKSSLETINNNTVVITNSIYENAGYYYFYCFNANNTREMTGSLVYDKADKDKATAILNHILNSIKFKD